MPHVIIALVVNKTHSHTFIIMRMSVYFIWRPQLYKRRTVPSLWRNVPVLLLYLHIMSFSAISTFTSNIIGKKYTDRKSAEVICAKIISFEILKTWNGDNLCSHSNCSWLLYHVENEPSCSCLPINCQLPVLYITGHEMKTARATCLRTTGSCSLLLNMQISPDINELSFMMFFATLRIRYFTYKLF